MDKARRRRRDIVGVTDIVDRETWSDGIHESATGMCQIRIRIAISEGWYFEAGRLFAQSCHKGGSYRVLEITRAICAHVQRFSRRAPRTD